MDRLEKSTSNDNEGLLKQFFLLTKDKKELY